MTLKVNGTEITNDAGGVKLNGTSVAQVNLNGTKVWPDAPPPPAFDYEGNITIERIDQSYAANSWYHYGAQNEESDFEWDDFGLITPTAISTGYVTTVMAISLQSQGPSEGASTWLRIEGLTTIFDYAEVTIGNKPLFTFDDVDYSGNRLEAGISDGAERERFTQVLQDYRDTTQTLKINLL